MIDSCQSLGAWRHRPPGSLPKGARHFSPSPGKREGKMETELGDAAWTTQQLPGPPSAGLVLPGWSGCPPMLAVSLKQPEHPSTPAKSPNQSDHSSIPIVSPNWPNYPPIPAVFPDWSEHPSMQQCPQTGVNNPPPQQHPQTGPPPQQCPQTGLSIPPTLWCPQTEAELRAGTCGFRPQW